MAVQQARFAGCVPPCAGYDYGALLPAALANDDRYRFDFAAGVGSAAQSELTCNGAAASAVAVPSRKRGTEDDLDLYYVPASSAALLPIPGTQQSPPAMGAAVASRMAQSAMATTSGRPAAIAASMEDALAAEMCRQDAEIDALVRAGCDRLRTGLEQARKRQRNALARAAAVAAARALRDREVELYAVRRRAAELEERLRQVAAEGQAWRDVARGNEAVAAGLRTTLETLLGGGSALIAKEEGFGDSGEPAAADDAQSCCFVEPEDAGAAANATSSPAASKWACRACGGGQAPVLLLPCRHLCLCKACEPLADACPVCLAAKNGAIHVATRRSCARQLNPEDV